MNNTIETMKQHRSIRSYLNKPIADEVLDQVLQAAQAMPTSINGQQCSIIVVKNTAKKQKIAKLAANQQWIGKAPVFLVFTADFYRSSIACEKNGQKQIIQESLEGTLVGAIDVGIALGAAIVAAESLDLGIVPIGAIRNNPAEMIELLELPKYTYPIVGLAIGYPADKSAIKPRLPFKTFIHKESYDSHNVRTVIDEYDKTMEKYYRQRGDKDTNWSRQIADIYKQVYFPAVYPTMKAQGFLNNK
ncbi:NADPH-dependent oxidoreductase [Pectinatus frisingensis]|uniref:NADPH-dependent oxidoreductase n=1 Tax=Pectinatus frisingensis TaxID=865 RepID=UPI0018C68BC9|nr:NADPH-dependent oxidoreductase [Pectinatus frisingensis]